MTTYKNYDLRIWDKGGFQEDETQWVIEVSEPGARYGEGEELGEEYDIVLSEQEVEELKLEEEMAGSDIWDRDFFIRLSDFIDDYDVPKRVYDLLESLPD